MKSSQRSTTYKMCKPAHYKNTVWTFKLYAYGAMSVNLYGRLVYWHIKVNTLMYLST